MKIRIQLFWTKLKLSYKNLAGVFANYKYIVSALIIAVAFFEFVYWAFNLGFLVKLISSPTLSFIEKLSLILGPFTYVRNQNGLFIFSIMILLAVIQGLLVSALIYAVRNHPKANEKIIGESALISLVAIIGLGCPACGTSLLTPLLALFISGSTVSLSHTITVYTLPVAIIFGLFGLYSIGLRISTINAHKM